MWGLLYMIDFHRTSKRTRAAIRGKCLELLQTISNIVKCLMYIKHNIHDLAVDRWENCGDEIGKDRDKRPRINIYVYVYYYSVVFSHARRTCIMYMYARGDYVNIHPRTLRIERRQGSSKLTNAAKSQRW